MANSYVTNIKLKGSDDILYLKDSALSVTVENLLSRISTLEETVSQLLERVEIIERNEYDKTDPTPDTSSDI